MQLKVSILGAGPAGFALTADLSSLGTSVLLYSHPQHPRHANNVLSKHKGHLKSHGAIKGTTLLRITFSIQEAVEFSKILILTVPSTGQRTILNELKSFDLHHHTIIAVPGNLFSLIAEKEIEAGHILETNISPYSCRMDDDGELTVFGKKGSISIAALQKQGGINLSLSPSFKTKTQRIFPQRLQWCHNVVEVSLSNINGVFHPLMILMNAGRIESTSGDFLIYTHGLTRSVANAIEAVDAIRLQIGSAFGFQLLSVVETSNRCYGATFTDLVDLAQNSGPHMMLKAPGFVSHRNVSEDVPDLLVCWYGLAGKLGVEAEAVKSVVGLASMATGTDYMSTGRNLRNLHLEGLGRGELLERFSVRGGR
ncbi:6-phosphogluconate dehydrogenase [Rhexocercosporidium sp. MPI-PUGE-AT-0058]|nr:6-phosphogluconate dehydrogenase [Rhexocercosporidium sp. MPI-PUGE-AT-0058]